MVGLIRDCGYTYSTSVNEDIGYCNGTAVEIFALWWISPLHDSNMLGPDKVAIGVARAFGADSEFGWYWTAVFGGVDDGSSAVTPVPPPRSLPDETGDTNCDGVVNPLDAALILQLSAGMIPALPCPGGGDNNGDGITNSLDAALILQFSAGLLGSLPP